MKSQLIEAVISFEDILKNANDKQLKTSLDTIYSICETGLRGINVKYEDNQIKIRYGKTTMTKILTMIADIIETEGDEKLAKNIRKLIGKIPRIGINNSLVQTKKYVIKHLSLNINSETRHYILTTIDFCNAKLGLRKIEAKEKRVKRLLK